jgi:prepilin-type processing-associated H-X9-DG protein
MQLPPAKPRRQTALTLLELVLVIVCLGVIAGLILPPLAHTGSSKQIRCIYNLKQTTLSFQMWAGDNNDKFPMQVSFTNGGTMELVSAGHVFPIFQVMSNELNDPRTLICPQDTHRKPATHFTTDFCDAHLSYFVNADADPTNPAAILAGDRNLEVQGKRLHPGLNTLYNISFVDWTSEIHNQRGNVALADGSVQQCSSESLRSLFLNSGLATNRLILP